MKTITAEKTNRHQSRGHEGRAQPNWLRSHETVSAEMKAPSYEAHVEYVTH